MRSSPSCAARPPTATAGSRRCRRAAASPARPCGHRRAPRLRAHGRAGVMKVAIGSDHAGVALKERVKHELERLGHTVEDVGTFSGTESVDYPDYAIPVGE